MKNILRKSLILSLSAVAVFALAPTSLMADKPDSPPGKPTTTPPESPPGNPGHTPPGLNKSILKQTGQTKSYDRLGDVVTDGSVKDDGYYQTGVTPFYTRDNENETVRDHITGLIWQDDEDAVLTEKPWVTYENYNDGNYFNTDGDTAYTYS